MRNALTLIELILSMVIIAIVFTVIPRLIHALNQTSETAIKEEAMYNAISLMGAIVALPWDENNTRNDQILQVNAGGAAYECNTTSGYRIGGFIGGRNCIEPYGIDYNATPPGQEGGEFNDIDDYTLPIETDSNCSRQEGKKLYTLTPAVRYVADPAPSGALHLSAAPLGPSETSNTKHVTIRVGYHLDHKHHGCVGVFEYHSFNIGHAPTNAISWE